MTKSIQQVNQELKNLESAAAEIAVELQELHLSYLETLAQSLNQQLILACYQICTRLYPQSFLELSLGEKQELQQQLRQLSTQLKPDLIEIIEQKELEPEPSSLNLMAELIKNLPKAKQANESGAEIDLELVKAELENIEFIEIAVPEEDSESKSSLEISQALSKLRSPAANSDDRNPPPSATVCDFENPKHLILWHKQVERNIKKTLDSASRKVNLYFQESGIIPDRIPSKIIDIAIQADSGKGMKGNRKLPNIPHVIHLAVESDLEGKSKSVKDAVQVSLLRLRLTELEFSDPMLNAKRGQIRNLVGKIKKLNSKYEATKQEATVLEAQAAWRSSWYED